MKPPKDPRLYVPPNIKNAIDRYVRQRIPPDPFTRAVLERDLEAVVLADETSLKFLKDIYMYVYNYIPSMAWGSPERVKNWLSGETQRQYGYKLIDEEDTTDGRD